MKRIFVKVKNPIVLQLMMVVVLVTIIVAEIFILTHDNIKKALQEDEFQNVKVTLYSQTIAIDNSELTEEVIESEPWPELPEKEEVGMMTVAGEITCSEDAFGKFYFLKENKEDYVIRFVDDDIWDDSDSGHWEKELLAATNVQKLFNLPVITGLTKKDFEKIDDYYVLKTNEKARFYEIVQILPNEGYVCDYLKFYFKDDSLSSICAAGYFGENSYFVYEYVFEYDVYSIELPKTL